MPIMPGTRELGPDTGSLRIETKRGGAAAKAGHDLVIGVRSWRARLVIGDDPADNSLALSADSGSMEVLEGTGGVMTLTDEDKAEIKKTLEEETLEPGSVEFRSTQVTPAEDGRRLEVTGELEMNGATPTLLRARARFRRIAHRDCDREADRLGHQALLRPVRHPEGQG